MADLPTTAKMSYGMLKFFGESSAGLVGMEVGFDARTPVAITFSVTSREILAQDHARERRNIQTSRENTICLLNVQRDTCFIIIGIHTKSQLEDKKIGFPHPFLSLLKDRTFPLSRFIGLKDKDFPVLDHVGEGHLWSQDFQYRSCGCSLDRKATHRIGSEAQAFSHLSPFAVQPASTLPFLPNMEISHSRLHRKSV